MEAKLLYCKVREIFVFRPLFWGKQFLETVVVESCLLHFLAFATEENHRHVILANLAAATVFVVVVRSPWILFRDSNRLGTECADTFRVRTAAYSAGAFAPANLDRTLVQSEAQFPTSIA